MQRTVLGIGRTADVFDYENNTILKLFKDFLGKENIDREFFFANYAASCDIVTPKPIKLMSENGRYGIIYEKIDGITLLKLLSKKPLSIKKIAREMAQFHFKIHNIEL